MDASVLKTPFHDNTCSPITIYCSPCFAPCLSPPTATASALSSSPCAFPLYPFHLLLVPLSFQHSALSLYYPLSYFLIPVFSPPPFALLHLTFRPSYPLSFCLPTSDTRSPIPDPWPLAPDPRSPIPVPGFFLDFI